ncbi:unnamed protein product [Prorocentrum cordatum]|uniref:Uncharacterized protein n=1 Tax=Prorocentrum cordatum TaxID=2364126 RepID=A0ABN9UCM0_9DINO|nr:unnamed protein product [Polarella glacialis]
MGSCGPPPLLLAEAGPPPPPEQHWPELSPQQYWPELQQAPPAEHQEVRQRQPQWPWSLWSPGPRGALGPAWQGGLEEGGGSPPAP